MNKNYKLKNKNLVVIIGPSASGKTDLAIKLSKKLNTNILSADSRQIYTGLDYSTGKLPLDYRYTKNNGFWDIEGIKYYGYDIVEPNIEFSAGDFVGYANSLKDDCGIICGGTGLYISAVMGKTELNKTPKNNELRKKLSKKSAEELLQELENLGYKTQDLNNSEKNNKQRLIRKVEIITYKGRTFTRSDLARQKTEGSSRVILGLNTGDYDKKIENWTNTNFENIKVEVESLIKKYPNSPVLNGFIFDEMQQFINGEVTKDQAKQLIYYSYRQYIKRQMTYFKKYFPNARWFEKHKEAEKYIFELF